MPWLYLQMGSEDFDHIYISLPVVISIMYTEQLGHKQIKSLNLSKLKQQMSGRVGNQTLISSLQKPFH